jgi:hypothetical protein
MSEQPTAQQLADAADRVLYEVLTSEDASLSMRLEAAAVVSRRTAPAKPAGPATASRPLHIHVDHDGVVTGSDEYRPADARNQGRTRGARVVACVDSAT